MNQRKKQTCQECGAPLEKDGTGCSQCPVTCCPFCGHQYLDEEPCPHLLGRNNDELGLEDSPLEEFDLSHLEEAVEGSEFSEETLQAVFGEMLPLFEAGYPDGLDFCLEKTDFFEALLEMLTSPVEVIHREVLTGAGEWRTTYYYAAEPDKAKEEIAALLARFVQRFETLAAKAEGSPAEDEQP